VLKTLDRGYVRFELRSRSDARGGHLNIRVLDSGAGFDAARVEDTPDVGERGGYHGRGIGLVRELTDSLTFRGNGNDVEAVLRWGDGACDDERAR
jgi:hypothetical protein